MFDIIQDFNAYPVALNGPTKTKMQEFATMIESFHAQLNKMQAYDLAYHIAKSSGVLKDLYNEKDKGPEEVERYQNIEELLNGIKAFTAQQDADELKTLSEFMIDVALLTDADSDKEEDKNKITLMTIHSSKGLEFPHVYLVGVEENLFPSQMSLNTRSELEEERRLFYVAVTRAEKTCTISYAASRFVFGSLTSSEPSRFISEINKEYVSFENPYNTGRSLGRSLSGNTTSESGFSGGLNKRYEQPRNLRSISEATTGGTNLNKGNEQLKVGYNVLHERFGKGKIIKIEGEGAEKKAVIFFPQEGSKTLLLKFAKLDIVD